MLNAIVMLTVLFLIIFMCGVVVGIEYGRPTPRLMSTLPDKEKKAE